MTCSAFTRRRRSPPGPAARHSHDRPQRPQQRESGSQGRLTWWRDDRGSVAAEVTLVTPFLIMLLVFVAVVLHRGVDTRLRLNDAAHQAARAASIERTRPRAIAAAHSTATTALASAGVTCQSLAVDTATGGMTPGGTVTVTISCTVDFGDALMLGVPGQKSLSATASEPIDTWRSHREHDREQHMNRAPRPVQLCRWWRTERHRWWRADEGRVTAFVVTIALAILVLAGLSLDGGLALAAKVKANGQAEAAARAGAQAIDLTVYRTNNRLQLVPAQAVANAQSYLATVGASGTVTVFGDTVTVTITASQPTQLLGLVGVSSLHVHGVGSAHPQRGVVSIDP